MGHRLMLDAVLPGGLALVRDFGPGYRDHCPIGSMLARRGHARELVIGTSVGHDVADRVPDQGAEFGAGDVVERVPGHEQPAEHRAQ